jgi:hypothetical protein
METMTNLNSAALMFAAGQEPEFDFTAGAAPGSRLYATLPAANYHADRDALSCSMLKPLLKSPAHFQANLMSIVGATKAMDFGSLVHGLVLEPHLVGSEFAVYPGIADGRSSEYKSYLEKHASLCVVDEPTFERGRKLAEKILHRIVFGRPFGDYVAEGIPEASIYVVEPTTGLLLRTRMDLYHPEFSFDLKTTRHSMVHDFVRDAVAMDYDFQAFMYTFARALYEGGTKPAKFVFVAAESDDPSSIHQVTAGESFMNNGAKKFQEALSVYSACTQSGFWPDSSGNVEAEIEPWQSFSAKSDWKNALTQL